MLVLLYLYWFMIYYQLLWFMLDTWSSIYVGLASYLLYLFRLRMLNYINHYCPSVIFSSVVLMQDAAWQLVYCNQLGNWFTVISLYKCDLSSCISCKDMYWQLRITPKKLPAPGFWSKQPALLVLSLLLKLTGHSHLELRSCSLEWFCCW
jgi:hypothetical protein